MACSPIWHTRQLALVTGLLLPVWSSLPSKRTFVRRLKAPDGRRWLGWVLDPTDVTKLKIALGISDVATAVGSGDNAANMVLGENSSIALTGGFWLRRAKVMDRYRVEVVGAGSQRAMFQALGCFVEIINYTPRVFVLFSTSHRRSRPSWPSGQPRPSCRRRRSGHQEPVGACACGSFSRDAPGATAARGERRRKGTEGSSDREWIRRETAGGPRCPIPLSRC